MGAALDVVGADPLSGEPEIGEPFAEAWLCVTGVGDRDGVWLTHPDAVARPLGAGLCDDARNPETLNRHGGPMSQAVARQAAKALATALSSRFEWRAMADTTACVLPDGAARGH
ncbi:hypothetical protein WJ972_09755 [Achromobacter insuavis]